MKNILFFLVALFSLSASAQNPVPVGAANSWVYIQGIGDFTNVWNAKLLDTAASKLIFPLKMANRWAQQGGVIYYNPTGTKFIPIGGVPLDTSSLSSRIDQRVKYADTAAMLISYATKSKVQADSNALAASTNQRVKYADTSTMLAPYVRTSKVSADSAVLAAALNQRVRYTDTAAMLLPYATDAQLADTAAAIRTLIVSGSSNVVKYTDTAAMLAPYATKVKVSSDSIILGASINQRVKYNDTAAMLAPYALKSLLSADSLVLANSINQRLKYTDTAAMLSVYGTKAKISADSSVLRGLINLKIDSIRRITGTINVQAKTNGTWATMYQDSVNAAPPAWSLTGNSGTSPGTNFIGTTDNQAFQIKVNNNTFLNFLTDNTILMGNGATNTSSGALAMGTNASANFLGVSVGFGAISSNQGVAVGREPRASVAATAIGYHAEAQNQYSLSLGAGAQAKHDFSGIITDGYSYDNLGTPYTTDSARKLKLIFAKGVDVYSDNTTPVCKILGTGDLIVSRYVKPSLFDYVASNAGTVSVAINTEYAFYGITAIYTMPAVSGNSGKWVRIVNIGTGIITVNSNAGGSDIFTTSAVTTTPVAIGGVVTFKCYTVGANTYWKVSE